MQQRLDVYLVELNLVKTRQKAQSLIKEGFVKVNGKVENKPSFKASEFDKIEITGEVCEFVSRGGLKLKKAIEVFKINVKDKVCLDVGASTGGFTDCLLQNGASFVYALDVGHDQLDETLKSDSRVKNLEGINIRDVSPEFFDKPITFAVCDVSFISLKLVLLHIKRLICENSSAVVLVKPQFEAGKENIKKGGIVKDKKAHIRVLEDIISFCYQCNFQLNGIDFSPIKGGDGNVEYLLYLSACEEMNVKTFDIKKIVENAFSQ